MKLAERLAGAIAAGVRRIGQVSIEPQTGGYLLRHIDDEGLDPSALELHEDPEAARDISTWAKDGHYRFTKGELSLIRGWLLKLESAEQLKQALDLFYPSFRSAGWPHRSRTSSRQAEPPNRDVSLRPQSQRCGCTAPGERGLRAG
jgi:hypothetical protein